MVELPKERDTGQGAGQEEAPLDALCDQISRIVADSIVGNGGSPPAPKPQEARPGPPPGKKKELSLAETGLIAPLGDMVQERALRAVERLLDSEAVAKKLDAFLRERAQRILARDAARSRAGEPGFLGERIRLECLQFLSNQAFRAQIVRDVAREVTERVTETAKKEVLAVLKRAVGHLTDTLLERLSGLARELQEANGRQHAAVHSELRGLIERVLGQGIVSVQGKLSQEMRNALRVMERRVSTLEDQVRLREEMGTEAPCSESESLPDHGFQSAARERGEESVFATAAFKRIRRHLCAEGIL